MQYQCLVTTDLTRTPEQLHPYHRDRWSIEESFMDLTRDWPLDQIGSCRPAVARALIHFLFLADTLLHLFAREMERADAAPVPHPRLLPGREITAYWGPHYAIVRPRERVTIILDHIAAGQAHREQLLTALRFCEGQPAPRAPD